jgi:hypothetical protein
VRSVISITWLDRRRACSTSTRGSRARQILWTIRHRERWKSSSLEGVPRSNDRHAAIARSITICVATSSVGEQRDSRSPCASSLHPLSCRDITSPRLSAARSRRCARAAYRERDYTHPCRRRRWGRRLHKAPAACQRRALQRAPPHPDALAEKVRAPLGWQGLPAADLLDQVTPAFAGDGGELHAPAWRFLQERPPESRERPDRAGAQPPACS